MRILYVAPHYPPDLSALAARVNDLTRRWAAAGHDVHVLCGLPCHPTGVLPPAYKRKVWVHEEHDGVHVHRSWVYAAANKGKLRRSVSFASFAMSALTFGPWLPRPDVVISTSPQFLAGVSGALLGKLRGVPLVVEIRDLWPASITDMGVMDADHPVIQGLEAMERWLYRTADTCVVVSEAFQGHIQDRHPGRPLREIPVITNGVDLTRFGGEHDGSWLRAQVPGEGPIVLYAGTHGLAQGLDVVIDAARKTPEARFVFVGEGAAKADLMASAADLANVTFLPGVQRDQMPDVYAAADACVVPLRDLEVFTTVIPSKLFEIWAMRRPVVLGGRGTAKKLVEDSGGGVVVEPEDADQLAAAIRALFADPERARKLGEQGRAHVEAHYDRDKLAADYLTILRETIERAS